MSFALLSGASTDIYHQQKYKTNSSEVKQARLQKKVLARIFFKMHKNFYYVYLLQFCLPTSTTAYSTYSKTKGMAMATEGPQFLPHYCIFDKYLALLKKRALEDFTCGKGTLEEKLERRCFSLRWEKEDFGKIF